MYTNHNLLFLACMFSGESSRLSKLARMAGAVTLAAATNVPPVAAQPPSTPTIISIPAGATELKEDAIYGLLESQPRFFYYELKSKKIP